MPTHARMPTFLENVAERQIPVTYQAPARAFRGLWRKFYRQHGSGTGTVNLVDVGHLRGQIGMSSRIG